MSPLLQDAAERLRELAPHLLDFEEAVETYDRVTSTLRAMAAFAGVGPQEISNAMKAAAIPGLPRGDVAPRAISAVLRNRRAPKVKWLLAYADVFGTDLPKLLEFAWGWNGHLVHSLMTQKGSLRDVDPDRVEWEHRKLLASLRGLIEFRASLSRPRPPVSAMAEPIQPLLPAGVEWSPPALPQMVSAGQRLQAGLPSLVQWRSEEDKELWRGEFPKGPIEDDPLFNIGKYGGETGIPDLAENIDHYLYGHPKVNDEP